MKIWDYLRAVYSDVSGHGRPKLLLQHEVFPLVDAGRDYPPLSQGLALVKKKRAKEVVYPVRQHQSNQQTMEFSRGLPFEQTQSQPEERQQNHLATKISQRTNRVQVKKRFSGFRELQKMNQLTKREKQTQALRPGENVAQFLEKIN